MTTISEVTIPVPPVEHSSMFKLDPLGTALEVRYHFANEPGNMRRFREFVDAMTSRGWACELKRLASGSIYAVLTGENIELTLWAPDMPDRPPVKHPPIELDIEEAIALDDAREIGNALAVSEKTDGPL